MSDPVKKHNTFQPVTAATVLFMERLGFTAADAAQQRKLTMREMLGILYVLTHDADECSRLLLGADDAAFNKALGVWAATLTVADVQRLGAECIEYVSRALNIPVTASPAQTENPEPPQTDKTENSPPST